MAEKQEKEKQGRTAAQEGSRQQTGGQAPGPQQEPIERLKEAYGIPDAVYRGMAAMQGWKPGRMASAGEFLAARDSFLNGPVAGIAKKKRMV